MARFYLRLLLGTAGTSRLDVNGEIQVAETTRIRVRMQDTGAELSVVVMKPL